METGDVIKKASEGTLRCSKCGSEGISLQNVRVGMKDGKPFVDPSAYGLCGKCGARFSFEKLQKMRQGSAGKQWWQFWK